MNQSRLGSLYAGSVLLGRYRVERILGEGGMGIVLAARHLELDDIVAIKLMTTHEGASADVVASMRVRFTQEARASAQLRSEHVPHIYDVGCLESGEPYMVMEYLQGTDLSQEIDKGRYFAPDEAVDLMLQACQAIAVAHAKGIVHRDLKPANLFLTAKVDGTSLLKVLDFGISKMTSGDVPAVSATRTRTALGTSLYMPPEQIRSARSVDGRADIWALGVTLFELLTHRHPFEEEDVAALAVRVCMDPPSDPVQFRPDLPPGLVQAILRCLEKEPSKRFQNISEFAMAIAPFASEHAKELAGRVAKIALEGARRVAAQDSGSYQQIVLSRPATPAPHASQRTGQISEDDEHDVATLVNVRLAAARRAERTEFASPTTGPQETSLPQPTAEIPTRLVEALPNTPRSGFRFWWKTRDNVTQGLIVMAGVGFVVLIGSIAVMVSKSPTSNATTAVDNEEEDRESGKKAGNEKKAGTSKLEKSASSPAKPEPTPSASAESPAASRKTPTSEASSSASASSIPSVTVSASSLPPSRPAATAVRPAPMPGRPPKPPDDDNPY